MKISIPIPCHEKWEEMTPNERGRFCANCQKTVIDFTNWTDNELIKFLQKNSSGICGKFRLGQLNLNTNSTQLLISRRHQLSPVAALTAMYFIVTPLPSIAQNLSPLTTQNISLGTKGATDQQRLKTIHSGIKGIVTDDQTNEIVIGAAVLLSNIHENIITDTITDTSGHFIFENLKPGYYKISVKYINYDKSESQLIQVFENKYTAANFCLSPVHLMGLTVVTVVYPENPKLYWRKHPWKFIKRKILKIKPI